MNPQAIHMLHRKDLLFSRRHRFHCLAAGVVAWFGDILFDIDIALVMRTRKRDLL
jgi:hypothetical protein